MKIIKTGKMAIDPYNEIHEVPFKPLNRTNDESTNREMVLMI